MKEKLKFPIVAICSLLCLDILGCSPEDMDEFLCSPKVETLGDFQKNFGKYDSGDTVMFEHSNGYSFNMVVVEDSVFYFSPFGTYASKFDIPCKDADNVPTAHQMREVLLESDYPMYTIQIKMAQKDYGREGIDITFGQYEFTIYKEDLERNPLADSIGSLEINGKKYDDVIATKGKKVVYGQDEDDSVVYKSVDSESRVFYNKKKGILKIELEDGSFIAINEMGGK